MLSHKFVEWVGGPPRPVEWSGILAFMSIRGGGGYRERRKDYNASQKASTVLNLRPAMRKILLEAEWGITSVITT